ncbi:MAG: M36 family metallopeptidase [Acidobacteriota bacterium]|nr:M36 family metallopeptidase [Acidobacteriota bacterium]
MKKDLRAERKGLLLSFLTLGLVGALALLPSQFHSTANSGNQEGAEKRHKDDEVYDIRKDKSANAANALAEFRSASGKSELAGAQMRQKVEQREKALRERFPALEIKYNEELDSAAVISPRFGSKRMPMLTEPSTAKRADVLLSFVKENNDLLAVTDSQVDNLKVAADYTNPADDMAFVRLEQEINGIPVFQGELRAGFTKRGEIVRIVNSLASGLEYDSLSSNFGSPENAVRAAFNHVTRPMKDEEATKNEAASTDKKAVFGKGDWATTAEKIYFPTESGVSRPAWRVIVWETGAGYIVIVDAETGTLLWRKNAFDQQTQAATYNVYANTTSLIKSLDSPFPRSPGPINPAMGMQGEQATRTNVTLIGNESPYTFNQKGWITDGDNKTDGNNVEAGVDRELPDGVDAPITGSPNRVFDSPTWNPPPGNPVGPGDDPLSPQAQRGAVIQMFYLANRFHDETYRLGFIESERNYQHQNFSGLGAAGDRISAEGQDYSGFDNAQFSGSVPDGTRGKMQMFLWDGPSPHYDGTPDAEIVLHELAHGLSGRLHNNGSGLNSNMSRGMGEGWSDFYALSMLSEPTDPINGIYSFASYATYLGVPGFTSNYYYGIRRFPKAVMAFTGGPNNRPHNGLTFKHLNANCNDSINQISAYQRGPYGSSQCDQFHNAGEIWSSALWEVRAKFIQQYGHTAGTRLILQYVTNGMKLDPINPTMLDARNSIIAAAAAGANPDLDASLIWQGFAIRGMGFSASVQSNNIPTLVTEAFDLPNVVVANGFSFSDAAPGGDGDGFAEPGETLVLTIPVENKTGGMVTGVTVNVNGGTNASYGNLADGATVSRTINFTVPNTTACGSNLVLNFNINGSYGPRVDNRTLRIGEPVYGFQQNFDGVNAPSLPAGWTSIISGANAQGWRTSTASSDSAPNSVFVPNPDSGGGADLTTPVFTLNSNDAILSFRHRFQTEKDWDGGSLEISISGGAFQEITAAGGTFITGGYNGPLRGTGNPLEGRNGWTGNSNGYITTSIQLPPSAHGVAVQLRWRMGHDNSEGGIGWNVDNIRIIFSYSCNNQPPQAATVRADFDADGRTDRVVFRSGNWFQLRSQNNQPVTQNWGIPSDTPVSGDFDGDRKADPAVYRNGAWYVLQSSTNTMYAVNWGQPGDIPVPADYTGDGKDDAAIFRNGLWAVFPTGGGAPIFHSWGQAGDKPVAGKYDSDAKADFAVFRAGNWYIQNSSNNAIQAVNWGFSSDILVPGDYTGDGIDDVAVFRSGTWYIRSLSGQIESYAWGLSGDVPVPGDYDGDKKLDPAVFRNGAWYVLGSSSGFNAVGWGQAGDTPIPSNYTK